MKPLTVEDVITKLSGLPDDKKKAIIVFPVKTQSGEWVLAEADTVEIPESDNIVIIH